VRFYLKNELIFLFIPSFYVFPSHIHRRWYIILYRFYYSFHFRFTNSKKWAKCNLTHNFFCWTNAHFIITRKVFWLIIIFWSMSTNCLYFDQTRKILFFFITNVTKWTNNYISFWINKFSKTFSITFTFLYSGTIIRYNNKISPEISGCCVIIKTMMSADISIKYNNSVFNDQICLIVAPNDVHFFYNNKSWKNDFV